MAFPIPIPGRSVTAFGLGGLVIKRSVDILLAGVLLIAALPVLVFAAILIKLDSKGPVLFRQIRVGREFKYFHLLKLRTMADQADGSPYTLGADPRITGIGCWLRRLKVDELPQLWHVLTGEMSLVGPRPVVPELSEEYRPAYRRLLTVRPGLTDPASIKYCQESDVLVMAADPLGYFHSVVVPDKLSLSQAYMERATVWSDLGILARTALVLFRSFMTADTQAGFEEPLAFAEQEPWRFEQGHTLGEAAAALGGGE